MIENIELCNNGRCQRVRKGEERHTKHGKIDDRFSDANWKKFVFRFWSLVGALLGALILANWYEPESVIVKIGIVASIFAPFIAVYIAVWTYRVAYVKKQDETNRTNHAKKEIYSTLRNIEEIRKQRERIRTVNPLALSTSDLDTEIRFMNHKLKRVIESLQFVLSLHSAYLPSKFVSRVSDAINGYDFILGRLDIFPLENDDPKKVLTGNIEKFIEELEAI